jgi:hypothetical protein
MTLLVLSAAPRPAAAEVTRETSAKTVSAAGIHLVRLENSRGSIDVRTSADGMIHVTALKEIRGSSMADRRRNSEDTRVVTGTDSGTFSVRVIYPSSTSVRISFWDLFQGFDLPRCEVRLTVDLPPATAVALRSASGDLSTTGVAGSQLFETSSGDVRVQDAGGFTEIEATSGDITAVELNRARVRTSSGNIQVEGARGAIDLRSRSGDISVRGARDSIVTGSTSGDLDVDRAPRGIRAESTSGKLEVREASGAIQLSTENGDVDAKLLAPLSRVDVDSGSGDIDLTVDREAGFRLDVRTTTGTIDAELPIRVTEATRHALAGVVGSGQVPMTMRTSSGDIHVRSGGR